MDARRGSGAAVLVAVLAAALLLALVPAADPAAAEPSDAGAPVVGVLQPPAGGEARLAAAGVQRATLEIGWEHFEPSPGQVDARYAVQQRARVAAMRAAGLEVVLDLGLQYPPAWVMALPGARFRDQDGAQWRGPLGEDVPDAVWNPAVRKAQAAYVARVAEAFPAGSFVAVRVGGLLSGELRMPPESFGGARGRLWGFSDAARAAAPSGWRPGTGSHSQAAAWLAWYTGSLTGYETWLLERVVDRFPGVEAQVLFPGWGLRPGDVDAAAASLARGSTGAEQGSTLAYGLDWPAQVAAAARVASAGHDVVVYSTWLDAQGWSQTAAGGLAPPDYLFGLARAAGLPVAGENTGGGGRAALERAQAQVRTWGLRSVMWMSAPALLAPGAEITAEGLARALRGSGGGGLGAAASSTSTTAAPSSAAPADSVTAPNSAVSSPPVSSSSPDLAAPSTGTAPSESARRGWWTRWGTLAWWHR